MSTLNVIFEDNHLLVVNKPAGLVSQGAATGQPGLVEQAKSYLKQTYHKPGNVYLGVVSRLDSLVSGVLVLARTSKAAARLTEQFRSGTVQKTYWALVDHPLPTQQGRLVDHLIKDESKKKVVVVDSRAANAKQAMLEYRRLAGNDKISLCEINLLTGRKHQIRVQMSANDAAILGDRKYGSRLGFDIGIALHSRQLALDHPTTRERMQFDCPLPSYWPAWARAV